MLEHEFISYLDEILRPSPYVSLEKLAALQHQSAWADVAAKAKRLVQTGKVTILHNMPHYVMSHVIGDHGEYNCEVSRHDPNSQIIEQWNCECPWAQYAFDRTRKWKKLEGRVCSHVLATYWKAKSTPLDASGQEEGFQAPQGQQPGALPGQEQLPGTEQLPEPATTPDLATTPELDQNPTPVAQPPLPSNDDLIKGQPVQNPFAPSKQPQPKPTQPQLQQLHLFDITAPPGGQALPMAQPVSIPGGRPPTPGNPVQFPGTFSHFIPTVSMIGDFIYSVDALTEYFMLQRSTQSPIYCKLTRMVTLELTGGKIPMPDAQPIGTSSEGVPLYNVLDLGYNPATGQRENADENMLQGAPEQTNTYIDIPAGKKVEVLDFDSAYKMAYIFTPMNYPEGGDVRLHPHGARGWVDYADLRPATGTKSPFRV